MDGFIGLIILVVVVGIVVYLLGLVLDIIPMDGRFRQIAWVLILLVAGFYILKALLPMLGLSLPSLP